MENLINYIFKSDLETAKLLIDSGANINIKYGGVYPIDAAINSDDPKTLKFVINNGANLDIEYGLPLMIALDYCMDGMIQNQISKPYPEALEMVRILLEEGADISIRDLNGNRPIDVLKAYASDSEQLMELKELFRIIIQDIDQLLK